MSLREEKVDDLHPAGNGWDERLVVAANAEII